MKPLLENLILLIILVAFAIYSINWGAPKVGEALRERLTVAAEAK